MKPSKSIAIDVLIESNNVKMKHWLKSFLYLKNSKTNTTHFLFRFYHKKNDQIKNGCTPSGFMSVYTSQAVSKGNMYEMQPTNLERLKLYINGLYLTYIKYAIIRPVLSALYKISIWIIILLRWLWIHDE